MPHRTREEMAEIIRRLPRGQQAEAVRLALQLYGPAEENLRFKRFQFAPDEYIAKFLGWKPWTGLDAAHPGQLEILNACALAVRQQLEKRDYENGVLSLDELQVWQPGETIKNWFRVESGNGIGKTKLLSGAVQWFFDCFNSVVYTFHTTAEQDQLTTWAEIGQDRSGKGLPGRILTTKIDVSANRFAVSRTTSNAGGKGEERTKGKHKDFLMFVVDEADGVEEYVFKAIETMESGGISVVLMTANPRSRSSKFHRLKTLSYVQTFRVSSLYHPNVVEGREIIPGGVRRGFIEKQMETGVEIVAKHNPKEFTFDLPYAVKVKEIIYPAGTIFRPQPEFMWTVLGIAPPNSLDNTIISVGVYEAAKARKPNGDENPGIARVGVDGARDGTDKGTIYIRWQDAAWCAAEMVHQKTADYVGVIKTECLKLKEKGVTSLHIRVDAAYGSGVIDGLRDDAELAEAFADFQVFEVHFGSSAFNTKDYDNIVTEMYFEAAESLTGITVVAPADILEIDLTERKYKYINRQGKTRKILEPKDEFKKRAGHSPDHGDGLVLALAPDYCFKPVIIDVSSATFGNAQMPTQTTSVEDLERILGLV